MHSEEWIYRFGDVEVEPAAHRISRGGADLGVEPKAYAVLVALLEQHGKALERDALLDRVWGHRHVTPGVLNRVVAQLRKALGDDAEHPRYIQTLHSLGYRFIGEVERFPAGIREGPADEAASLATESTPALDDPALRTHAPRRLRHFVVASALALAVLAISWLWQRQEPPRPEASIAVLPFASLSDRPEDSYFAEGLAVEMHDALAGVQGLTVAARMTSGDARRDADVKAIGKRLGVATVLDASVRREGSRLRISARLADTGTGYTLWSHSYDRQMSDVFATQSDIADQVVRSLLGVMAGRREALARRLTPTRNVAAFDAYLKGLQLLLGSGDGGDEKAAAFFEQALTQDRDFARAQAGVCRSQAAIFETRRDAAAYGRAEAACKRAERMDATLGEVQLALADLSQVRGDLGKAIEHYARAQADPARRPAAYVGMAIVHAEQGRYRQAWDYFSRAAALRPGDAYIHSVEGYNRYLAGDLVAAIAAYRRAIELKPDDAGLWNMLGMMHLTTGDNAQAERALRKSISIEPNYAALSNLGELEYQGGRYAAAARLHRKAAELEPGDFLPWGNLGDALSADPRTASQARPAYLEAVRRAQRYIAVKTNDAKALAALAWYRASLGEGDQAMELVSRSEALGDEPAEVALFNAQTLAVLGRLDLARRRIAAARAAGLPEARITTNPVLRRTRLVSTGAMPGGAAASTPGNGETGPSGG